MARFEVWQDGVRVAAVDGPGAEAEGFRYLVQYAQDGRAELFEIKGRKRVSRAVMGIAVGSMSFTSVEVDDGAAPIRFPHDDMGTPT